MRLKRVLKVIGILVVLAWLGWILIGCAGISLGVAAFIGNPTAGVKPLTVQFTDQSTGTPTGWAWDFNGDGVIDSTVQNPSYSYTTAGIYTVRLTVSYGGLGTSTETKHDYIKVGDAGVGVPGGQATLGAAIAAAPPGGIVLVGAGTYHENIEINKAGLRLLAASRPVIDGNVTFDAPNILIQGFEITGKLITTANAKDETVRNCRVYGKEFTELLFDAVVNAGDSIQAAINAAAAGNVILVCPGKYNEQVTINKNNLTVRSADGSARDGSADTIISPPESTSGGVLITSDGSALQGFKIIDETTHTHTHRLIKVEGDGNGVLNNWIVGRGCPAYEEGVVIRGETTTEDGIAEDNVVENNEVDHTCIGINSVSVDSNRVARGAIIRGNYTHDNAWIGISIDRSPNSLVENNTLGPNNNSYALYCQARETTQGTWASVAGSIVRNNLVQNNPEGARFEACGGVTVGGSAAAYNTFTSNTIGIRLVDEAGNTGTPTVNYNNITGNGTGVSNDTTTGETLNAENNWWGCTAGPGNPGCDTVLGNVDFTPWATAPF